jgi:hypothetical protein
MILKISDKKGFIDNFLKPLNRFSETAILKIENNAIDCLISSLDNTTILNAKYLLTDAFDGVSNINIPNLNKFIDSLKIINSNELELVINANNVEYISSNMKFKFHLYEDGILSVPKINLSKVNAFEYDVNFSIPAATINQLVKSSVITSDVNKVYLFNVDDKIFAELTDRTIHNSDMFSFCIADSYRGNPIKGSIPLMLDAIRSFSALNLDTDVCINNEYGIAQFKINTNQSTLQYIVTSVVA